MSERRSFVRHEDDKGIDEVLFCGALPKTHEDAKASAFLRLGLCERYKTSGMSGDEWRFSTVLQIRERPEGPWADASSGWRDIEAHAAFLYAELYGDFRAGRKHEWLFRRKVGGIAFAWKGLPVWCATYDGAATDLLVACGHLPGALIMAGVNGAHPHEALSQLCCQPGCSALLVSVYRKIKDYCRWGHASDPYTPQHRGFCAAHLRRGDCGLDDADENYEVVSGPGPDGHEPATSSVSPSGAVVFAARGVQP